MILGEKPHQNGPTSKNLSSCDGGFAKARKFDVL